MTKEELLKIPRHSRIRYIGKNQTIIDTLTKEKKTRPMEQIVYYVSDYSTVSWGNTARGIVLRLHFNTFEKVDPAEWEVVDSKRMDLTRSREKRKVKYADKYIRKELNSFATAMIGMKNIKSTINYHLEGLPLADKLKVLTGLTDEQKLWFEALDLPEDALRAALREAVEKLVQPEEETELPQVAAPVGDAVSEVNNEAQV